MEWLGVWNCNFSGSEFSDFGAWNLAKIVVSAEFQGLSWKIRPLKNIFRSLENGHSIRRQSIPPLSASRINCLQNFSFAVCLNFCSNGNWRRLRPSRHLRWPLRSGRQPATLRSPQTRRGCPQRPARDQLVAGCQCEWEIRPVWDRRQAGTWEHPKTAAIADRRDFLSQTSPSPAKPQRGRFFSPWKIAKRVAMTSDFPSQGKIAGLSGGGRTPLGPKKSLRFSHLRHPENLFRVVFNLISILQGDFWRPSEKIP